MLCYYAMTALFENPTVYHEIDYIDMLSILS